MLRARFRRLRRKGSDRIGSLVLSIDDLADVNELASGLATEEIYELSDEVR